MILTELQLSKIAVLRFFDNAARSQLKFNK